MFLMPGEEAAFQENRSVPHGEIRQVWYHSATLGEQRRLHLYTPPGYDRSGSARFPVLYLLHGGGDDDSGWSTIGRAGFILDNLIAQGKARPMVVVMPNGSFPRPANRTPGTPRDPAAMAALRQRFTSELMNDILPFVEKSYRVATEPRNRAIAGLSMGGFQTLGVVTRHPDRFAYVGVWSAGIGNSPEWETQNAAFLKDADRVNKSVKQFDITVGDKDFTYAGSRSLSELLGKHKIKSNLQVTGGGHTWINWRRYLSDFASRLFR
jgi:enterochelin esterase family protein